VVGLTHSRLNDLHLLIGVGRLQVKNWIGMDVGRNKVCSVIGVYMQCTVALVLFLCYTQYH